MWIPNSAALIRGQRLYEIRQLLEETRNVVPIFSTKNEKTGKKLNKISCQTFH